MERIVSSLLIFLLAITAQAQCDLSQNYEQLFKIEKQQYGERSFLHSSVKKVPGDQCYSEVVNGNNWYFHYLLNNFTDRSKMAELEQISEQEKIEKEFYTMLKNNNEFNEIMQEFSAPKKDTISMDQLLNVAVKYFNIKGLTAEGSYKAKVCGGLNGISQTLTERKPHLEAFSFSVIFEHINSEEFNMHNELVSGIKELYTLELGNSPEEKLLRAQGAMYMIMRNNEQLRRLLLSEYQKKKDFLPFVLEQA